MYGDRDRGGRSETSSVGVPSSSLPQESDMMETDRDTSARWNIMTVSNNYQSWPAYKVRRHCNVPEQTVLPSKVKQDLSVDRIVLIFPSEVHADLNFHSVKVQADLTGNFQQWKYILSSISNWESTCTVMILSFRTDIPGQTVQTQIRLLLEEQSDQGLHCLPFCLHCLDSLLYGSAT